MTLAAVIMEQSDAEFAASASRLGKDLLARRRRHTFSHEALVESVLTNVALDSAEGTKHRLGAEGAHVAAPEPAACFTPTTTNSRDGAVYARAASDHRGSVAHLLGGRELVWTGGET